MPNRTRHLALHDQYLIAVNDRDHPFVTGSGTSTGRTADAATAAHDHDRRALELAHSR